MGRLLIIGCGGVAGVAIHKCCQNSKTFSEICIASRTKEKCDALKEKLQGTTDTVITTAKVDADNVDELIALIRDYKPDAVLNVALPYQDLTTRRGVQFMRSAARRRALPRTSIIPGSGHIRNALQMPASRRFLAAALTRA